VYHAPQQPAPLEATQQSPAAVAAAAAAAAAAARAVVNSLATQQGGGASLAAQDADVSSDVSSGASHAAVTPIADWQLLDDTCKFLDKVVNPRATAAAVEGGQAGLTVVSDVLTVLQACAEHAAKNNCSSDAQYTAVLRVSLQDAYDNNTVLLQEASLISEWTKQCRRNASVARQHIKLVSYNFSLLSMLIKYTRFCVCMLHTVT
jgi:hypothetical protein